MVKLLRRASLSDLPVNKPLEWSIYDANNNLILRKGIVISMPGVAEKIVNRGYFLGEPNPADTKNNEQPNEDERDDIALREPVFVLATELITSISRIHKIVLSPPSTLSRIEDLVLQRARQLIQLLKRNSDAVLAALYLNQSNRETRPVKHVLGAAIAYLIAIQSCDDEAQLLPLICAALTRDISLYHCDHTSSHIDLISDHEYSRIKEHTVTAVRMLRKHGIQDEAWLRYVYEHHEKPDGSGVDIAELFALKTLSGLNERVKKFYPRGVRFNIRMVMPSTGNAVIHPDDDFRCTSFFHERFYCLHAPPPGRKHLI
jgi:hypothetical protein